jgi:hypothetical protein
LALVSDKNENPLAEGNIWILLQCTIGVLEWQPVGIGALGQAVPEHAAGLFRRGPKSLFW